MQNIEDQPPPIAQPSRTPAWELVQCDYLDHVAIITKTHGGGPDATDALVLADMRERDKTGRDRYGVPLTSGNGRNQLIDAYQEMLDKAVYLRAWLDEQEPVRRSSAFRGRVRARYLGIRSIYDTTLRQLYELRDWIRIETDERVERAGG